MSAYLLLTCAVSSVYGSTNDELKSTINQVTTTQDGALYCPVPVIGTVCGKSSVFHYYQCCGDLNKECCFNLQTWVIVTICIFAVIILASLIISVVRCLFCSK